MTTGELGDIIEYINREYGRDASIKLIVDINSLLPIKDNLYWDEIFSYSINNDGTLLLSNQENIDKK